MEPKQCTRRVAVVGCGVSGLAAIKACLEEGLEPHCFEMNSDIGGLWYTTDAPKPGGGPQIYDSLITNTSKAMMCFSDFPFPADYPPYLPHKLYQQYLHSYAEHFDLLKHITFNTKVIAVTKAEDYVTSGRWVVATSKVGADKDNEETLSSSEFEGVILCQGFYRIPYSPHIPGMKGEFRGKIHHVISYKNPQQFSDRTVIVVGSSASAGDVACDIAPVAKQVYLSVHHGAYTISRLVNGRVPLDFLLTRATWGLVPRSVSLRVLASRASKWLDPVSSGLKPSPSTPWTQVNIIINDQLPFKVMTGQVKIVSNIAKLTSKEVHLEDGTVLRDVDDIIFATGYKHDFSVIHSSFVSSEPESGKLELYKMTFPLSLPHDTLALIGCLRAVGPIPPVVENQARLAARVISGKHKLPERSIRKQDVDAINNEQLEMHGYFKYGFQYLAIADSIAAELGVRPNWWQLCLQGDLKMALAVLFGPAYPFHYRLLGPHSWHGARDAIVNAYNETVFAVQHRKLGKKGDNQDKGGMSWLRWMLLPLLIVCLAWLCL